MRIGIDARMLGKGYGIGRYIEQLILHLIEIDRENQYVLFIKDVRTYERYEITKKCKIVLANIPWYSWAEQVKFKKIIKKEKIDLMHFPHWNVPLLYNDPFVVTIHDLIMFHYPRPEATTLGSIKFWLKDKIHRLVLRHAVKKAKKIIAVSEFTKRDVAKTLSVPEDKIQVIYQAPFGNEYKVESIKYKVLEKYGIDKPYILYVGAAYPHKNLEGLLKAWQLFGKKYGEDYQLVLAGKEDYFYNRLKTNKLISQLTNKPIFTGFVSDDELEALYSQADLYIFPSLFEGFGLPALEALAHCLPVASSNRTSLPEILGEAALYFDPENIEQMADVIYVGLTNEDIRFELKNNARDELKRYSLEKMAGEISALYKRLSVG